MPKKSLQISQRITHNAEREAALDFAQAKPHVFEREISSVTFYRNKTKAIILTAKDVVKLHGGKVPKTERDLVALHGVGYKTAHVILGELYEIYSGIPTDTHVKRFAT